MKETENIKGFLESELESWAAEFLASRINYLRTKQIGNSGELVRSMEYEINRQAAAEVSEVLLAFENHGRIIDMKRIDHDIWGRNAMDRIMAWVQRVGVEKFTKGYLKRRKYIPKSRQKLIQSIAWGTLVNRSKGKFRRKRWYNKSKTAAINDLFNEVASKIPDIVGDEITKQFPKQI